MNKQILILSIVLILLIVGAAIFNYYSKKLKITALHKDFVSQNKTFKNLDDREKVTIVFNKSGNLSKSNELDVSNKSDVSNEQALLVEVVNSPETTKQGLSDRDEIGSDGMLFVFPSSIIRTFWMLNMRFDLDFVWINGDKVVGLNRNIKKPEIGTKDRDLELISINKPTDKVLEINAGNIERYKIELGDVVMLK